MGYSAWFHKHAARHKAIVDKLLEKGCDKEQIIDYFDYDSMVKNEPTFCPLYKKGQKCHTMEHLNCYLCGCPIFRFSDKGLAEKNGLLQMSDCAAHRNTGKQIEKKGQLHQDCTYCTLPHERAFIEQVFSTDWLEIMKLCEVDGDEG